MKKERNGKQNSGYSLIELVITVAILGMVGIGIGVLMLMGTRLYARQNADVNLQAESQIVKNQLKDYLLNANRGVYFEKKSDTDKVFLNQMTGADACLVVIDDVNSEDAEGNRTVKTIARFIVWYGGTDSENGNRVYYNELPVTISDHVISYDGLSGISSDIPGSWPLLAQYVTGFDVRISKTGSIVNSILHFQNGADQYNTTCAVTMRNDVASLDSGTKLNSSGIAWNTAADATSVTVTPSAPVLAPGTTQTFSAAVEGIGYPDQAVKWQISGVHQAGTVIDEDGKLTVAADEDAKNIQVIASTQKGQESITGTAYVSIAQISSITISAVNLSGTGSTVIPGTTIQMAATVNGSNLTGDARIVQWSCTANDGTQLSLVTQTNNASLTIPQSMETDTTITVMAAFTAGDTIISGTRTFTIGDVNKGKLTITADSNVLVRGGNVNFSASLYDSDIGESAQISWSVIDDGGVGSGVSFSGTTLYADKNIRYGSAFTVKVQAAAYFPSLHKTIYGVQEVTIPKVSVKLDTGAVLFTKSTADANKLTTSGEKYIGTVGVSTVSVGYSLVGITQGTVGITVSPATSQISAYLSGNYIVIGASQPFVAGKGWNVNVSLNGDSATSQTIAVSMNNTK